MSIPARFLLLVALCLGLGLAWFGIRTQPAPVPSPIASPEPASLSEPGPKPAAPAPAARDSDSPTFLAATNESAEPASAPTDLADEERAPLVAKIEAAYTTYRPEALPVLAPYLTHSDPAIREFAREAVVQVGHHEGAAVLRAAADKVKDPREAVALLDAADFLEIPPALAASGTFKPNVPEPTRDAKRSSRSVAAPRLN